MQIRPRTLRRLLPCLLVILLGATAARQDLPLSGQLLATTNGAQDSVLVIETNTGRVRAFSVGSGIHTVWDFSPDGCDLLVTVTGNTGLARLFITTLSGQVLSEPVRYSGLPDTQWGVWEPDWSPDGSKIAFRMTRDGLDGEPERQYHIAWVPPAGGEPTFYSVSGREHSPRWSPDGNWLAYVSYDLRAPGVDSSATAEPTAEAMTDQEDYIQEADLWVVAADASVKTRKTAYETGSVRGPRWSPDGGSIAYVYSPSPSNDTYWTVENVKNARPFQVTYGYGLSLDLTWTPDGELLASARGLGGLATHGLWRIPIEAGADEEVTPYLSADHLPYPDYPAFNSDSSLLAVRSGYRAAIVDTASFGISFVLGADGNMPLIWSPAAFTSEDSCPAA